MEYQYLSMTRTTNINSLSCSNFQKRPIVEPMSKKNLMTVEKNILKMFDEAPEALGDDELAKLAELTEEISFVDKFVAPAEERREVVSVAKGRK